MALTCPHCRAQVGEEAVRCHGCGAELDPFRTIQPPGPRRFQGGPAPTSPTPEVRPRPAKRPERPSSQDPSARGQTASSPRPGKSKPPRQAGPPPPNDRPPAPAQPVRPPTYPPPPPMATYGQAPQSSQPASGGGVRGWMIRMLGGTPEAPHPDAPPASLPGYYPPPGDPYAGYPPPPAAPNPPGAFYPPLGYPYPPATPPVFAAAPAPAPESPATPFPEFDPSALAGDDDKTRFLGGVDIAKLRFPKVSYTLQIMDTSGRWHDWGSIHASGINVGRSKASVEFPGLNSMAVRHMRLSYNKSGLLVEDLGALNGVYLRIGKPVELIDGMRFRIGLQTLEFHQAEPFEPLPPAVGEDGEEFCSNDLGPLAFLDMIRPNGRPGLRIPLTRTDATIIGREGLQAHIMLAGDHSVSAVHALVRHEQGQFFLEDLKSRNGTFIHVLGSAPLHPGNEILAGRVKFRVVNQATG